jgi:hypothetical protein
MNLVPLKVKITLKDNGQAKYPDFNQLQEVIDSGMDWSIYVDKKGMGWKYDDTAGHADDTPDSPYGQQWGMLIVPKAFADQAVAAFPEVTKMTDAEAADFYDNKVTPAMNDFIVDEDALLYFDQKEKYKLALTPEDEAKKAKALDPDDDTRGIRKNKEKKWADYKQLKNITIVQ